MQLKFLCKNHDLISFRHIVLENRYDTVPIATAWFLKPLSLIAGCVYTLRLIARMYQLRGCWQYWVGTIFNATLLGIKRSVLRRQSRDTNRNIKRSVYCQYGEYSLTFRALTPSSERNLFLSDEGPMLETLDHTIRIGSTPTFLYFDLLLCIADSVTWQSIYYNVVGTWSL